MPYVVVADHPDCPQSTAYAVLNKDTGKRYGCHATKAEADDQQRALYAATGTKAKGVGAFLKQLAELLSDPSNDIDFYPAAAQPVIEVEELPVFTPAEYFSDLEALCRTPITLDPDATLTKEQHKRVANVDYPASNFAIVRDAQRPDTWGILLVAGVPNRFTAASLMRAAAMLTPGTAIYKALNLEQQELTAAKRRIVAELRKLGVPPEKFPEALQTKALTETFLIKDSAGQLRWFAAYSNNCLDNDNPPDLLSEQSHRIYATLVKTGAVPMPELWFWHIPGTRLGVADLVDVADGIAYASGLIDPAMTEHAQHLEKLGPLGVSHGMPLRTVFRNPDNPRVIDFYVSDEISVLPLNRAANPLTTFFTSQGETMSLTKDQREALVLLELPPDQIDRIETALGSLNTQAATRQRKEGDSADDTAGEPPAAVAAVTPQYVTADDMALLVNTLTARFATLEEQVAGIGGLVKELKEADATKIAKAASDTPPASLASLISSLAITQPAARVDGRGELAKSGPEQTKEAPKPITGISFIDQLLQPAAAAAA